MSLSTLIGFSIDEVGVSIEGRESIQYFDLSVSILHLVFACMWQELAVALFSAAQQSL